MKRITRKSYYALFRDIFTSDSKVALIDKYGYYTQKESFDILCGLMNELSHFGVKRNDVVVLSSASRKETALIIAAIIGLGAIAFLKDPNLPLNDFLSNLEIDIKYKAHVFFDGEKWAVLTKKKRFLTLSRQDINVKPHLKNRKDRAAVYLPTSGSSGKNKIVALSEYGFLNHVTRQDHTAGKKGGCGYLCLPLFHMFGLEMVFVYLVNGSVYVSDSRNPELAIDIINQYQCTAISNVPTFYFMLIDASKKKKTKVPSLKHGVIAGGPYSKEQFLFIEKKLKIRLISTYGLTEGSTTLIDTYGIRNPLLRSSGVGRPFSGVNVVLKDDKDCISKTSGEVCFNGYNLMLGYVKDGGLDLPLDKDGYFHTGDIASVDEEGIYHIIGRKKDIIIRGGENLSPALIEQKIMTLDFIKDACVVGVKDDKYGEVVAAYLASDSKFDKEEILDCLRNILNKSELPAHIIVSKDVPMLGSGKHDKNKVRQLFADLLNSK